MNNHPISLGLLMLDIEGTELTEADSDLLQRESVGGLILFSRNYQSPTQLQELVAAIRELRNDILIAVD
ncbi:MAG: beta-N-acetylhexosaminidase, partial [Gammaproteobacteria bacterium]|nr:beta-N-acetylhexosaminidase [Gammaproteobacteria bacterium]